MRQTKSSIRNCNVEGNEPRDLACQSREAIEEADTF